MKKTIIEREPARLIAKHPSSRYSIVCGTENPGSLHCVFYEMERGGVITRFTPTRLHEGHGHMMHGGYISAVLDEVMGRAIHRSEEAMLSPFVTAEMTVHFLQPIPVGQPVCAIGEVVRREGRRWYVRGQLLDRENVLLAASEGVYAMVPQAGDDKAGEAYQGLQAEPLGPDDPQFL